MSTRRNNVVDSHLSQIPEIGQWLWAIQDTRLRTMEELEKVTPAMIDWLPAEEESSIGTMLYHIAAIEADWLYVEALEQEFPAEIAALFPYEIRDEQGNLLQVTGLSMDDHLNRLKLVRERLLDAYQQMDLAAFRHVRTFPHYDVTPEWVLHHLMQHEAEHRSQIGTLRIRALRSQSTN
ncbi:MAG: DinB family protein [Caldilineaceae bacterium]